jgi:hypothetical protein
MKNNPWPLSCRHYTAPINVTIFLSKEMSVLKTKMKETRKSSLHIPVELTANSSLLRAVNKYFFILSGVRLAASTGLLHQPQTIDDGDCGEIGGMKTGRRNRSSRRKPAPAPLGLLQIPHD